MQHTETLEPTLWAPLSREEKNAEAIARPPRRSGRMHGGRLCHNKVAMLSMVVIALIALTAIFVPFFWPYSYDEQNLDMVSLPPTYDCYTLGDGRNYYVTQQYSLIEVADDGTPVQMLDPGRRDTINLQNLYEVDGKVLALSYGAYRAALTEYQALETQAQQSGTDTVNVADAAYLQQYFADDPGHHAGQPRARLQHPGKRRAEGHADLRRRACHRHGAPAQQVLHLRHRRPGARPVHRAWCTAAASRCSSACLRPS